MRSDPQTITQRIERGDVARKALRVPEAAEALGVSRSSLYALIRSGKLGFCRIAGGSVRVPASELDAFIERGLIGAR